MKKIFTLFLLLSLAAGTWAVPAKKGLWKTLKLDGTPVEAQLVGDEHMHYWLTADGQALTELDGTFVRADMAQLRQTAMSRRAKANARRQRKVRRNAIGDFMNYSGKKKGLIILVEFSNLNFQTANDSLRYTRICNEEGYDEGNFQGSVYDYFKAQSYGEFELTFDVMGPVKMPQTFQYYGQDVDGQGNDAHPGEMVAAACQAVANQVNFADYDWDGDGYVDQVMCIYAGQGQADGGSANTIWPHEWELEESDFGHVLEIDGIGINTYAVANEVSGSSIEGIGTICHEFSHCLGLPDMYDVNYGGNYGMGEWSLMDTGSYNGNGFCPSGYSSFDKYTCGWVSPVRLDRNMTIEAMQPLEDTPEVYLVANNAYEDEYFLLENRQQKGWDAEIPGNGLLILYVDFDREIWEYNLVNTNWGGGQGYPTNDHQRCTVVRGGGSGGYWDNGSRDAYPSGANDSLTNTSSPAARLYHDNTDGSRLLNKGIVDIVRNSDGTVGFRFRNTATEVYIPEGTLLYETFDACNGNGGNDGVWSSSIASSKFQSDNEGWTVTKGYGGWQCARFGNLLTAGRATTPAFHLEAGQEAMVTFRAAGWDNDGTGLALQIEGNGTAKPDQVTMESFAWNSYTVLVNGEGDLRLTFAPDKRFLLDDVLVVKLQGDSTDAIRPVAQPGAQPSVQPAYYTLAGRLAGHELQQLPQGIYIERSNATGIRGRKVVVR